MKENEEQKVYGVYTNSILTKKVILYMTEIGRNVKKILEEKLANEYEGMCIKEGFVKPGSISVESYSSGTLNNDYVEYQVIFKCMICSPVEGMLVKCKTKTITKAGIHAVHTDKEGISPLTIFIARDHHNANAYFNSIKEDMEITVSIIGVRYELCDEYICAMAYLKNNLIDREK